MRVISAEEFAARVDLVPVPAVTTDRVPKHWRMVGESADGQWAYYEGSAIGRKHGVELGHGGVKGRKG